jgi:hypothetical protein
VFIYLGVGVRTFDQHIQDALSTLGVLRNNFGPPTANRGRGGPKQKRKRGPPAEKKRVQL